MQSAGAQNNRQGLCFFRSEIAAKLRFAVRDALIEARRKHDLAVQNDSQPFTDICFGCLRENFRASFVERDIDHRFALRTKA